MLRRLLAVIENGAVGLFQQVEQGLPDGCVDFVVG